MKRGQASIELIILVTIALFLLAGFSVIQFIQTKDVITAKKRIGADDITAKIKTEISLAGRVKPYYEREFELPTDIAGKEYDIIFGAREVVVKIGIGNDFSSYPKIVPTRITFINGQTPGPTGVTIPRDHKRIKITKTTPNDITLQTFPL